MGVPISLAEGADSIGRKDPKKVEMRTENRSLLSPSPYRRSFHLHLIEQGGFLITFMVIDPLTG